jgi:hypothetical protein
MFVLRIALSGLVLSISCAPRGADDSPAAAAVDRLEQVLEGKPCIGQLSDWERRYTYGIKLPDGGVDRSVIEFHFFEAGVDNFQNRRIRQRNADIFLYDGGARVAFGEMKVATGEVTIDSCGPNWPDAQKEPPPK